MPHHLECRDSSLTQNICNHRDMQLYDEVKLQASVPHMNRKETYRKSLKYFSSYIQKDDVASSHPKLPKHQNIKENMLEKGEGLDVLLHTDTCSERTICYLAIFTYTLRK